MTATDLLSRLRQLDIRLRAERSELRYDAPKGALSRELREELVRRKPEILALLEGTAAAGEESWLDIPRVDRQSTLPLSFAQQRLWFVHRLEGPSAAYNMTFSLGLSGPLDVGALVRSFDDLFSRHETFRTSFREIDGEPVQVIAADHANALTVVDLSALDGDAARKAGDAIAAEAARIGFDLARPPLARNILLELSPDRHRLVVTLHHIISDAWSMTVLVRELEQVYRAHVLHNAPALPPLAVQYADYASWQRLRSDDKEQQEHLDFWLKTLEGLPPLLDLPTDRPRPPVQSYRGGQVLFRYPNRLLAAAHALARTESTTLFAVLLAAFQVLLARYTNRDDVVVGSPVANRSHPALEGVIGFFVNNVVLRTRVAPRETFRQLLNTVTRELAAVYDHQDLPFDRLVERLRPDRDLSYAPIAQVRFILLNTPPLRCALPGIEIESQSQDNGMTKFDLLLTIAESAEALAGGIQYSTDLFDRRTIERIASHYGELLQQALDRPDTPVGHLSMLLDEERAALLRHAKGPSIGAARNASRECAHHLFEQHAARRPQRAAVMFGPVTLSYQTVDHAAVRLAERIGQFGIRPEEPVAIYVDRSIQLVIAVLAVLKAGGVYVPMDAAASDTRWAHILEDCGARLVLTRDADRDRFAAQHVISLDGVEALDRGAPVVANAAAVDPRGLAYVIYTSGSTGRPKGVGVSHAALRNYILAVERRLRLSPEASMAALSTVAADLGHTALFGALCTGRTYRVVPESLNLDPEGLADEFTARPLDCLKIVPAHLAALLCARNPARVLPRECLVLGGDVLEPGLVRTIRRLKPGCRIVNHYGPTEATVGCLTFEVADDDRSVARGETVPIGRPLGNTVARVLDGQLELVPSGVPGELFLGGANLARGYIGRPALTAERFVPDPYGDRPGARLYRTGDRVRLRQDPAGDLDIEFLGRVDRQIKIRGYRIELGEIEHVLRQHPGLSAAVVAVREDDRREKRIVAYAVARTDRKASEAEVLEFVRTRLPAHMVPTVIVFLESMPLTANGKLDRQALPDPALARVTTNGAVGPTNNTEARLLEIWRDVLAVDAIGIHDDFFKAGGHSLLATLVIARILEAFGVNVPVRMLFEHPTVAQLATVLDAQSPGTGPARAGPPITPAPRDQPLPLSYSQQRLWFLYQLDGPNHAFNISAAFYVKGPLDVDALRWSLREVVSRHEILRTNFRQAGDEAVQIIRTDSDLELPVESIEGLPAQQERVAIDRRAEEEARRPFDLEADPLLRATVLRLDAQRHALLITAHHIVFDGWSIAIFGDELAELYASRVTGRRPELPHLRVQYADFARWQRAALPPAEEERQLRYWVDRLGGLAPVVALPTDRPRPPVQTYRGRTIRFGLPDSVLRDLYAVADREGASLFMILLAIFQVLLAKLSGEPDIAVGFPSGSRPRRELETLIGPFINSLILRSTVDRALTFSQFLARVKENTLDAYAHQDISFEQVVAAVQPERSVSHAPLTQLRFMLRNAPRSASSFRGVEFEPIEIETGTSRYDLLLSFTERAGRLDGYLQYSTDLFDRATAQRVIDSFGTLAEACVRDPSLSIASVPVMRPAERELVLRQCESERVAVEAVCIHTLVEKHARQQPSAPAVIQDDSRLSYGELNSRANQVARRLEQEGVGPEDVVVVCMARSISMVTALLAAVKTGAAFLPLDPAQPWKRVAAIAADAKARIVLVDGDASPEGLEQPLLVLAWPSLIESALALSGEDLRRAVDADQLVYVIYTSGSTGRPKGVGVSHRALHNYIAGVAPRLALPPNAQLMALATVAADLAHTAMFGAMGTGRVLRIPPAAAALDPEILAASLDRMPVDALKIVPQHLAALLKSPRPERLLPKQCLIFGGAQLQASLVEQIRALAPDLRILNHYGPTETTVGVTTHEVEDRSRDYASGVPIGHSIANTCAYVVDAGGSLQPVGVEGELLLGGAGLARGYLDAPSLTARSFVPNPFASSPGERLYRTGDRVRRLADGNLLFVGRLDAQVKVRGFRVEPREVETVMQEHPGVAQAVVTARDKGGGECELVAYVVAERSCAPVLGGRSRHLLPNDMAIVQHNVHETRFMYRDIFDERIYLRHGVALSDGACVLDVGANIGCFSLFIAQHYPDARIYAFEPIGPLYDCLKINAEIYGPGIVPLDYGLSDRERCEPFAFYPGYSTMSGQLEYADAAADAAFVKGIVERGGDPELASWADELLDGRFDCERPTCRLLPLSAFLRREAIDRIDLLKIDVQGAERDVLRGIESADWPKIRQLVVEVHDRQRTDGDPSFTAILDELAQRGFDAVVEHDDRLHGSDHCMIYARRRELASVPHAGLPASRVFSYTPLTPGAIAAFLRDALPEYMVPAHIVLLEELPLNSNGKVDRRALPAPEDVDGRTRAMPRTATEEKLVAIWREVLKRADVGVNDNFYELGGDSLLATLVVSRARLAFGIDVELRAIYERRTIAALAEYIDARLVQSSDLSCSEAALVGGEP